MELERYNRNSGYGKKHKLLGKKFLILSSFLFVLGIIFFTTFYSKGDITGKVIYSSDKNNSIDIKTSFSVPDVSLNGEYKEIILSVRKSSPLYLSNKEISLDEFENKLVIKDFKGIIEINEDKINKLEGKVSGITINNIPINSQKRERLKFSLSQNTTHNSFEIKENVYLKDVSFITSGRIDFGEDSLNLDSEKIRLTNYFGGLKIENKNLILVGTIEGLKVDGQSRKITLSSS